MSVAKRPSRAVTLRLVEGEHLGQAEFHRRYEAMPPGVKAELIEGVVYMPSPVRQRRHSRPHAHVLGWLTHYEAATPGVESGDNGTTRLDLDNEPQPDALLFIDPLMSVISSKLDTHKDRETRLALEPLAAAAMDTDGAVVGLTHFSKSLTTDALNLVMASKAFTAVPRAVIGMARDDEAEEDNVVVLSQIKSNLGPLEVPSLKFTFQQVTVETEDGRGAHVGRLVELGESERSVDEILAGRGDEDDQETWNGAAWWLYDYVGQAGGEIGARDALAKGKAAGHSKDSIKRASQKLKLTKRRDGFQGPWIWTFDATQSKAPTGPSPMSAMGAQGVSQSNPVRSMRPLGERPKRRSRSATKKGGEIVPLHKPGEDPA